MGWFEGPWSHRARLSPRRVSPEPAMPPPAPSHHSAHSYHHPAQAAAISSSRKPSWTLHLSYAPLTDHNTCYEFHDLPSPRLPLPVDKNGSLLEDRGCFYYSFNLQHLSLGLAQKRCKISVHIWALHPTRKDGHGTNF